MRSTWLGLSLAIPFLAAGSLMGCGGDDTSTSQSTGGGTSHSGGSGPGGAGPGGSASGGAPQGGGGSTSSSSGNGGAVEVYPAAHPRPHTMIDLGGPIQTATKVQPIYFGNDSGSFLTQVDDFLAKIQSSTYFATAGAEYGVGPATVLPAIHLSESAPNTTSDGAIQAWLVSKIEAGAPFPQPDIDTTYVIFYPDTTTISDPGLGQSCVSYGAYHFNTYLNNGTPAVYSVIPRCQGGGGLSTMDLLTQSTSHELLEAATDPIPYDNPAYAQVDFQHIYVEYVLLAEVGDQCAFTTSGFSTYPDMPYSVQRIYSNQSAIAGHDPCVPLTAGEVYFSAAPLPPDDVPIGMGITMKGTVASVGQTRTIDVVLFSEAPLGEWQVQAVDGAALFGGQGNLDLSFQTDHGSNGDILKLDIKVLHRGQDGISPFLIYSFGNGQDHVWPGFVYTP